MRPDGGANCETVKRFCVALLLVASHTVCSADTVSPLQHHYSTDVAELVSKSRRSLWQAQVPTSGDRTVILAHSRIVLTDNLIEDNMVVPETVERNAEDQNVDDEADTMADPLTQDELDSVSADGDYVADPNKVLMDEEEYDDPSDPLANGFESGDMLLKEADEADLLPLSGSKTSSIKKLISSPASASLGGALPQIAGKVQSSAEQMDGQGSPEEVEIPTLPKDTEEAIDRAKKAHGVVDPMPQPKNTTTKKVTGLTEKNAAATEDEEDTLEALGDLQKPVGEGDLDDTLALAKATEDARLGEGAEPNAKSSSAELDFGLDNQIEEIASGPTNQQSKVAGFGSTTVEKQRDDTRAGSGKSAGSFEEDIPAVQWQQDKASALSPSADSNSSLIMQGAIIGATIKDMVIDNSSSIAGAVAVVLALAAGVGVACAGISIYRRFRDRKGGKPLPRIIEIGNLAQGRKSPGYTRVGSQKHDADGGSRWQDWDERWEDGSPGGMPQNRPSSVKQKKAWDWDADW